MGTAVPSRAAQAFVKFTRALRGRRHVSIRQTAPILAAMSLSRRYNPAAFCPYSSAICGGAMRIGAPRATAPAFRLSASEAGDA